jgi:hypothetical protein
MKACMFVASPPKKGDKAKTRKVFLKEGRRLVGYIFLPDGPGNGYRFQLLGRTHASSMRYRTVKLAKDGMGAVL